MIEGTREVAERTSNSAELDDAKVLLQQFREMARIAEHEMHEAVLACVRARRQPRPLRHRNDGNRDAPAAFDGERRGSSNCRAASDANL